jgi:hypothetical protein
VVASSSVIAYAASSGQDVKQEAGFLLGFHLGDSRHSWS